MDSKVDKKNRKPGKPQGTPKTGGRTKGTPNKRSLAFGVILDEQGFSIPEKAMELYNTTTDDNLKFKLLDFLATYSRPKIKDQEYQDPSETSEEQEVTDVLSLIKN